MFSRKKAAVWLLLALSVSSVVTADAFTKLHPLANFIGDNKQSLRFSSRRAVQPSGSDVEKNESSSSADNIPRGGANINKPPPPLPTLDQFRKFALPCLGLWVAQPLLSLVDTAFVGLSGDSSASARQLAALGPATTFFDGATYLFGR